MANSEIGQLGGVIVESARAEGQLLACRGQGLHHMTSWGEALTISALLLSMASLRSSTAASSGTRHAIGTARIADFTCTVIVGSVSRTDSVSSVGLICVAADTIWLLECERFHGI